MPDLFSEHRPAGSCLYSLECLHICFFFFLNSLPFLNATFALISSHDYSRKTYIFLKSATKCLFEYGSIRRIQSRSSSIRTHTTHHTKMKLVSMQKCIIILMNKLNKYFVFVRASSLYIGVTWIKMNHVARRSTWTTCVRGWVHGCIIRTGYQTPKCHQFTWMKNAERAHKPKVSWMTSRT